MINIPSDAEIDKIFDINESNNNFIKKVIAREDKEKYITYDVNKWINEEDDLGMSNGY